MVTPNGYIIIYSIGCTNLLHLILMAQKHIPPSAERYKYSAHADLHCLGSRSKCLVQNLAADLISIKKDSIKNQQTFVTV